jgi:hypothetical protein
LVNAAIKHVINRFYLATIFLLFVIGLLLAINYYDKIDDWKIILTIIGGFFSFIYFIQKQQLEEAKLFKELCIGFNQRYNDLNEKLNAILAGDKSKALTVDEINTLYDYFNLCGEEFLFYNKGFIYREAWESWYRGMHIYFSDPRIQDLWLKESQTGSYYGLKFNRELSLGQNYNYN